MTWMMSQVSSFGFNLQDVERYAKHGATMERGAASPGVLHPRGQGHALRQLRHAHDRPPGRRNWSTPSRPSRSIPPSPGHEREWLDCIRSREEPSCGVTYSHKVNTANMLANLAMKAGRELRFDPATETIVGDPEAARLARPEYRAPWKFPEEYLKDPA